MFDKKFARFSRTRKSTKRADYEEDSRKIWCVLCVVIKQIDIPLLPPSLWSHFFVDFVLPLLQCLITTLTISRFDSRLLSLTQINSKKTNLRDSAVAKQFFFSRATFRPKMINPKKYATEKAARNPRNVSNANEMRPFPTFPHTQNKAQKAQKIRTFSIYINAENLCFFNVSAASFRLNRCLSWKRFLIARLLINIKTRLSLKLCWLLIFLLVVESLFCSLLPASSQPAANLCVWNQLHWMKKGDFEKSKFVFAFRCRNYPFYLFRRKPSSRCSSSFVFCTISISRFLEGFIMNFEGLRDFNSNSSPVRVDNFPSRVSMRI